MRLRFGSERPWGPLRRRWRLPFVARFEASILCFPMIVFARLSTHSCSIDGQPQSSANPPPCFNLAVRCSLRSLAQRLLCAAAFSTPHLQQPRPSTVSRQAFPYHSFEAQSFRRLHPRWFPCQFSVSVDLCVSCNGFAKHVSPCTGVRRARASVSLIIVHRSRWPFGRSTR